MNIQKIIGQIQANFAKQRVVFWQDSAGEFQHDLDAIIMELSGIKCLNADRVAAFKIKTLVELEDTESKFLIYRTTEPLMNDDWLLNIKLAAKQYSASKDAVILHDLGLSDHNLLSWVRAHIKFFDSEKRVAKFKEVIHDSDSELLLNTKLIAITLDSEIASCDAIITKLLAYYHEGKLPDKLELLAKYGLTDNLNLLLVSNYGYYTQNFKLEDFIINLFVNDLYASFGDKLHFPEQLNYRIVSNKINSTNALFASLRDKASFRNIYSELSDTIAEQINLEQLLATTPVDDLAKCTTFKCIDRLICGHIVRNLANLSAHECGELLNLASQRQTLFWSQAMTEIALCYKGIVPALRYREQALLVESFTGSANEMYQQYVNNWYKFDLYYRQFTELVHQSNLLKHIKDNYIEQHYVNSYLPKSSQQWDQALVNGLLAQWSLDNVVNQYRFYNSFIHSRVADKHRTVVIISDGMRYEVARELQENIALRNNYSSQITTMLGVLPSYTKLGMAALLPHKKLEYRNDNVFIEGKTTATTEGRNNILNSYEGQAITFSAYQELNLSERKQLINQALVTYIYHDTIDLRGDKPKSENDTSIACREAIEQIEKAACELTSNYICSRVYVTSDHGFTFQLSDIADADVNRIELPAIEVIQDHKRFKLLNQSAQLQDFPLVAKLSTTSNVSNDEYYAILANRHGRFNKIGGAGYTHGGASLQEIVVPVVEIAYNAKKVSNKTQPVAAKFNIPIGIKITSYDFFIDVVQADVVNATNLADTAEVVVFDDTTGTAVSIPTTIILNATSEKLEDRTQKVQVRLIPSISFAKGQNYRISLRNDKSDKDNQLIKIDIIGFDNDF